jgi:hypothetical protein
VAINAFITAKVRGSEAGCTAGNGTSRVRNRRGTSDEDGHRSLKAIVFATLRAIGPGIGLPERSPSRDGSLMAGVGAAVSVRGRAAGDFNKNRPLAKIRSTLVTSGDSPQSASLVCARRRPSSYVVTLSHLVTVAIAIDTTLDRATGNSDATVCGREGVTSPDPLPSGRPARRDGSGTYDRCRFPTAHQSLARLPPLSSSR